MRFCLKNILIDLYHSQPFQSIEMTKDIRLYVSFLKKNIKIELELPWTCPDRSFMIFKNQDKTIVSVLDLSISKSPQAMRAMEKFYGSDVAT